MSGPYITGEIVVSMDNAITIERAYAIKSKINQNIMKKIDGVKDLVILADPEKM